MFAYSGNDAVENFDAFGDDDFLVKRNLRKESREQWLATRIIYTTFACAFISAPSTIENDSH